METNSFFIGITGGAGGFGSGKSEAASFLEEII